MTTPSSRATARMRATASSSSTGARLGEPLGLLFAAEVRPLEELGRQDDVRPARRRVAHVLLDARDVLGARAPERALDRGDRDVSARSCRAHASLRARLLLRDAVERAAAGEDGPRGDADGAPPGKSAPMRSTASSSNGAP